MKAKRTLTAVLATVTLIMFMFTAAYASDSALESARIKNVKITRESIESLLDGKKELDGIVIITLPDTNHGKLCIGKRGLLRGEGVACENIDSLYFEPNSSADIDEVKNASFAFTPVYKDGSSGNVITYPFMDKIRANNTPIAENIAVKTFKNVTVSAKFSGIDPDADPLTYTLTTAPKLGTVMYDPSDSGAFVYKPYGNKTGTDTFTYMACDDSGVLSVPAKVTVSVEKQESDVTYSDMDGNDAHYAALLLSECGIFTGKTIGDCTYFEPNEPVTRAEFMAMAVALSEKEPTDEIASSVFIDNMDIPVWCRPFAATAVTAGFVQGSGDEGARLLRANDYITRAEAAVVVGNTVGIEKSEVMRVYADETAIPTWAKDAMCSADTLGIMPANSDGTMAPDAVLTRSEAAKILCSTLEYLENDSESVSWFKFW